MFTKAKQVKDINKNMATCHKVHLSPAINHVNNQWISSSIRFFQFLEKNIRMGGRANFYLFPFWAYLDEVKWKYLVIPISSIKGKPDGQEGYNTTAFWEVFLLRKDKSTISEYSPVFRFLAFGWKSIKTGGRSNFDKLHFSVLIPLQFSQRWSQRGQSGWTLSPAQNHINQ